MYQKREPQQAPGIAIAYALAELCPNKILIQ